MSPPDYLALDTLDLALAATLLLLNAALSLALDLGVARRLLWAALRMVVQLGLLSLVLERLFALTDPLWTALAALVMILFAGREVMARQSRRLKGPWAYGLGTGTMALVAGLITLFALTTQIGADPWYAPRYALPLLGMILGNTMTGVSLGLDTLSTRADRERAAIEARLAMGAGRLTALNHVLREAMRAGLMQVVNAMSAIGLVFIPGMMTGQILAGADPLDAARYQILVMFLIAGATGLGTLAATTLGALRITDSRHRLRLDRLGPAK